METIQFLNTSPNALANLIDEKLKEQLDDLKKNFTPKEPEEFMSRNETAKLLKISLVTLHDWINKGILHPYKMGNKTYFSRKEITETIYSSNKSK
ncbi:helix-turn-helix domain-containing protein [Subsaxibacter sp. CAU 1640]|uniref:helix-turn-helix domain-containing protein n=1 Tax=Subsaxibacter sp. CAU 1640 TaxID=2933271 RepID=UPI0020064FE8|nr:helix-turn-helix domain-containing protein [Subsaxibacter sp. CAU 1640]MCK7589274.1 helix-turn-helix domain-containing protein [Subsaxibacter sp. CAU 1640]